MVIKIASMEFSENYKTQKITEQKKELKKRQNNLKTLKEARDDAMAKYNAKKNEQFKAREAMNDAYESKRSSCI